MKENRSLIQKIIEIIRWFLKKINEIDKPVWLGQKVRRHKLPITEMRDVASV